MAHDEVLVPIPVSSHHRCCVLSYGSSGDASSPVCTCVYCVSRSPPMPRVPQLLNYIVYPTLLAAVFVIAVVGYALLCNPQQLPPSGSLLHARIQNPPHVRGGKLRGNGVGLC